MFLKVLCLVHGGYYAVTGLWPLVHMPSFVRVSGPKTDLWLVRMVGALTLAIGFFLLVAMRERPNPSLFCLATLSALAFLGVDVVYVAQRTIGPVYPADAAAEAMIVVGWAACWFGRL